jgi:hypothetical protein
MGLSRHISNLATAALAAILLASIPAIAEARSAPAPTSTEPDVVADPLLESAPEYQPLDFAETQGAYAIYRDTRGGEDAYIGLCFLGGNELAVRLFVPATGSELLFTQTWYVSSGRAAPGTISLVKGAFGSSAVAGELIPLLTGWADAYLSSRGRFDDEPDFSVERDDGTLDFGYWVPVFRVLASGSERANPDTGKGSITLVTAGIAQSGNDPAFYAFRGFPSIKTGPVETIARGTPLTASVDGYSVALDSNWARGRDGIWRIARAGAQDAAFLIEPLDLSAYGDRDVFDLIRLLVLNSGWQLVPGDLRIFVFNECPCVFFRVFDPATETVTAQYKMFIPREGARFSMVSLSIYEPLYEANRAYFDSILF